MTAPRLWQYTAVGTTDWPTTPSALASFLDGMDTSGWEFIAPVGDMLVFRRRHVAPVAEGEQQGVLNG